MTGRTVTGREQEARALLCPIRTRIVGSGAKCNEQERETTYTKKRQQGSKSISMLQRFLEGFTLPMIPLLDLLLQREIVQKRPALEDPLSVGTCRRGNVRHE